MLLFLLGVIDVDSLEWSADFSDRSVRIRSLAKEGKEEESGTLLLLCRNLGD